MKNRRLLVCQAFHFGKTDFELKDTSRHFEGSFGSIRAILHM